MINSTFLKNTRYYVLQGTKKYNTFAISQESYRPTGWLNTRTDTAVGNAQAKV